MTTIAKNDLLAFAINLLKSGGFTAEHAMQTADLLVWANLRGVDSHGVLRIPRYVEMLELGVINASAEPKFIRKFGATALLDAEKSPGSVGMNIASQCAIDLSKIHGIGWCSARNITHAGAIGYFAQKVADAGLIGLVMTSSKPLMTYFGSSKEAVSTNPISISAPRSAGQDPIILDMSTAAVALGKIMAAKDAGHSIPEGWGVDGNGAATTDPSAVKALLPMAGAKGSGLSLMIEILSSVLAGNAIIAPALTKTKGGGFNGLVLAINPEAFGDQDDFASSIEELANAIGALPVASGFERVLLPGERGFETAKTRNCEGISLSNGTITRLVALAEKLNLEPPVALR